MSLEEESAREERRKGGRIPFGPLAKLLQKHTLAREKELTHLGASILF